jgi:hypothetical protein
MSWEYKGKIQAMFYDLEKWKKRYENRSRVLKKEKKEKKIGQRFKE